MVKTTILSAASVFFFFFFFFFFSAAYAQVSAPAATAKAKAKKKKTHIIQLSTGENVLYVSKRSAGFFEASISNRTFATVSQGYATIKAGKNIKAKLFAKPSCPEGKSYCSIKIMVHGPGQLVYGNLYRVFGYENLAVRRVFAITPELKVEVPKAITNVEPPAAGS